MKKRMDYDSKQTVELSIQTLQTALGIDLKASEIEVAVVSKENSKFRQIPDDEVEQHLTAIAERD